MAFLKVVLLKFKAKKIYNVDLILKASSLLAFVDGIILKICIRIIKRLLITTTINIMVLKETVLSCSNRKIIKYSKIEKNANKP